jgi:hypothetical protein
MIMKMNVNIDVKVIDGGAARSGSAWGVFLTTINGKGGLKNA